MIKCKLLFIRLTFLEFKMEPSELKKYLHKIADLVLDEEKIVTYKLLSRTLDIHVNTAKQLLHTFLLQQQELSPGNVSATYLLAGLLKDGSSIVSIVNGDNLKEAYLRFDIITSEHVYSVHKGRAGSIERNSEMLYIADSELKHKSWVIKCDDNFEGDIFERSTNTLAEDIEEFRFNESMESEEEKTEEKSERKIKKNVIAKQSLQKDKKRNSISHFFNNHSQKKKPNVEERAEEKPVSPKSRDSKGESSRNVEEIDLKRISPKEKSREEKKGEKEKPMSKSIKVTKKKSKASDTKKRKRIISDPEDSDSDEEMHDMMLCTEIVPEVPEDIEALNRSDDDDDDDIFRHKKKRKKFVDKTVLHEDGYMETTKEIVYETDSDSESQAKKETKAVENQIRKPSKPQEISKKKASAPKNIPKKQPTLLSFFKKT